MAMFNELQPFWYYPAWNLPNSNNVMALLEPMHHTNLPSSIDSHVFTANAASQRIPTHINFSYPGTNPSMNESQFSLLHLNGTKVMPTSACDTTGKKFLIFDQSGDQTRLFFSPSFPPQNELFCRTTFGDNVLHHEKLRALIEHNSPRKLTIQEQLDTNYSNSYGSERHEDTEEINALLYSDVSDDGDDEVISTGNFPFPVQESFHEHAQFWEPTEEIASYDGSSKRQRLHDGGYKNSSLKDTANSVQLRRSYRYNNDEESSCVKGTPFKGHDKNPYLLAREKKDKIREILNVLETMIPGLTSKDPLLVIDEAIDYLKCLRLKAKELGIEITGADSPIPHHSVE